MTVFDIPIDSLTGGPANLAQYRGRALLVVNVASRCGLTPQYAGLQTLADTYADRGLVVLGVPCNQFAGQEPGSAAEISDFCQVNYGVTFPLTEKVDVNGPDRHPLYAALVDTAGRRRAHRGRPLELREVPGRPGRHGDRPLRPQDRTRFRRPPHRDREGAPHPHLRTRPPAR